MYLQDKKLNSVLEEYFESISINEGIMQKHKDKKEAKRKQQEESRKQQTYDDIKKAYNDLINFLNYPFDFGSGGEPRLGNMIEVAKMLGINESKMMNRMKKIKFKDYTLEKGILSFYSIASMDKINKEYHPNLNNANLKIKVQKINENDDNFDFIGQDGKFYSIQSDNKLYIESFYSFYDRFTDVDSSDKDILIKVDQELGYYILSQPLKGTQKKKLPL